MRNPSGGSGPIVGRAAQPGKYSRQLMTSRLGALGLLPHVSGPIDLFGGSAHEVEAIFGGGLPIGWNRAESSEG